MDALSPDIARKWLNRDVANLAQRVQRGGNLTRSVAENDVELAKILGVTRRTLQNGRKRRDAPPPAANGFHEGLGSGGA
jgi:hypothetical protein